MKFVENFFEFNVDSRVREIVIFIYQKRKRDRMAKMNKLMKYCFSFPIESIQREPMIDSLVPFGIPIQGIDHFFRSFFFFFFYFVFFLFFFFFFFLFLFSLPFVCSFYV
jgi:hypothetical protein